jgi:tRNA/rRNA methyltransferase
MPLSVILVEPKGPENIGAVARAMMNTGFRSLHLINPQCDPLSEKSLQYAIHAAPILQSAEISPSLTQIRSRYSQLIAITRRTGSWRLKDLTPAGLPEYLASYPGGNIGLVFGREANGLTTDEIFLCDLICSIPSAENFPSLNLSHAVMVILYEIFKSESGPAEETASQEEIDGMISQIYQTLEKADFFKSARPEIIKSYIRKILLRARPGSKDTGIIRNIFRSLEGMVRKKISSEDSPPDL